VVYKQNKVHSKGMQKLRERLDLMKCIYTDLQIEEDQTQGDHDIIYMRSKAEEDLIKKKKFLEDHQGGLGL